MNAFKLKAFLCLLALTLESSNCAKVQFSSTYHAKGFVKLPYAELNEPFEIWYDRTTNSSRIDWYNGVDVTINTPQHQLKIFNDVTKRVCSSFGSTAPTTLIPDLSGFEYVGVTTFQNKSVHYLKSVVKILEKTSYYKFYYTFAPNGEAIPVYFWMFGEDDLLGSHYDRYDVEYTYYDTGSINSGVYSPNRTCISGYPTPTNHTDENEKEMAENPAWFYMNTKRSITSIHKIFDSFKSKFSKTYKSKREHHSRFATFVSNLRFVHSKNRAGNTFSLALNHLADFTENERRLISGRNKGKRPNTQFDREAKLFTKQSNSLPPYIDWRDYGAVTPVKDQAICGSCWSFGAAQSLEGSYFLKTGTLYSLSQQQLMDCGWSYGTNGCDGGWARAAFHYLYDFGGIETELSYGPYLGQNGLCHANKTKVVVSISGYTKVKHFDEQTLMTALVENGPIAIEINAGIKTFDFYSNGVYSDPDCLGTYEALDHEPLLIGYGTLEGKDYWLVKNSWSNYWGNDGYIWIERSAANICGVTSRPIFANLA